MALIAPDYILLVLAFMFLAVIVGALFKIKDLWKFAAVIAATITLIWIGQNIISVSASITEIRDDGTEVAVDLKSLVPLSMPRLGGVDFDLAGHQLPQLPNPANIPLPPVITSTGTITGTASGQVEFIEAARDQAEVGLQYAEISAARLALGQRVTEPELATLHDFTTQLERRTTRAKIQVSQIPELEELLKAEAKLIVIAAKATGRFPTVTVSPEQLNAMAKALEEEYESLMEKYSNLQAASKDLTPSELLPKLRDLRTNAEAIQELATRTIVVVTDHNASLKTIYADKTGENPAFDSLESIKQKSRTLIVSLNDDIGEAEGAL